VRHRELHRTERIGWLRAAVLGADDGIVSTASLLAGIAAANSTQHQILLAGVAGLVAGALSMAAGEYVSVSSQADTERADLDKERNELATQRSAEEKELAAIYVERGLDPDLAKTVALQLMAKNALEAHARDELGLSERLLARPLQAALSSAATFAGGAALPILTAMLVPQPRVMFAVPAVSLIWPCCAGSPCCSIRRRFCVGRCWASHFMGRFGHGSYSSHRHTVRNHCVVKKLGWGQQFGMVRYLICLGSIMLAGMPTRVWEISDGTLRSLG